MSNITWERRHEAFKAIWEKLNEIKSNTDNLWDQLEDIKVGTNNLDVLLSTRAVNEEGTIQHFSKTATGDVKAPASGKALRVLGWFYCCTADVITELRFKNSGNVIGALPTKGAVAMNLIGQKKPQGSADEPVEIYLSGTGTVKGWINYAEV